MYCSKCGTHISDAVDKCSACGQTPAATEPRIHNYAIVSLVLGIVSVSVPVVAPVGLVFGIIALVQINRSGGKLQGRGLAIAGVIVSSVMVAVGLVALALFVPLVRLIQELAANG